MIEVRVPKDINEYQEKVILGMSLRQLICFICAIVLCVGTYILGTAVLGLSMQLLSYVIMIEAVPLFAVGFIRKNGMPFEKYFMLWLRHRFGKNKLHYQTELSSNIDIERSDISEENRIFRFFEESGNNIPKSSGKRRSSDRRLRECNSGFHPTEKQRRKNIAAARRSVQTALHPIR